MKTHIVSSDALKKEALETLSEIAAIVCRTLGPGGNPIILQRLGQNPDGSTLNPLITKDGVSVAEAIQFRSPLKATIAQTILQVAQNTVKEGGDGTTTSVLLAEAIYKAGFKYIEQGSNGIQLYNDLKKVKDTVIGYIDTIKIPVEGDGIKDVARISANGDEEIANVVYEAIMAAGEDGYVSLEEGYTRKTTLETVDGAVYKQGWRGFGPFGTLMVSNKAKNLCELDNPAVLLYAGKLESVHDMTEFINKVMGADASGMLNNLVPLLIIANDYSDDLKNFLVQNRVQQKLPIAAIKSPFDGSPNARTEMLEDMAALLGATVAAKGILELKDIKDEHLGCAERIEIGPEETAIFNGQGSPERIMSRIDDLKTYMETANLAQFDKDNVRLRIGKLSGGIAIVRVGGDSELEMKERKDRIEDALCAAKAAIKDGIVPGGGYTLYRISKLLNSTTVAETIMKEALQQPIKQIIQNVGESSDVVLALMPENQGYDARNKEYKDLLLNGIVDPAKVTKSALENAVSIAGLLLTTGGALVSDAESKDGMANPFAAMMGGG
jgi:chaperonin GroEL